MLLKFRVPAGKTNNSEMAGTVTASWKFEISAAGTCARHLPFAVCTHEKTKCCINANDASYFSTELGGPFRDFFLKESENYDSLPDSDPESGLGPLASPARRSKRVKVEILNTEG